MTIPGQDDVEIRGPVGVRRLVLPCRPCVGHKHNYPHVTRFTKGRGTIASLPNGEPVLLEAILEDGEWKPSQPVTVEAGVEHLITPLECPSEYECEYQHRDGSGKVIEVYQHDTVDNARCYR